jgi:hypothetical protein
MLPAFLRLHQCLSEEAKWVFRFSRFSLDALVNISAALGGRVRVDLEAA